jgi:hypothetical protein
LKKQTCNICSSQLQLIIKKLREVGPGISKRQKKEEERKEGSRRFQEKEISDIEKLANHHLGMNIDHEPPSFLCSTVI